MFYRNLNLTAKANAGIIAKFGQTDQVEANNNNKPMPESGSVDVDSRDSDPLIPKQQPFDDKISLRSDRAR